MKIIFKKKMLVDKSLMTWLASFEERSLECI